FNTLSSSPYTNQRLLLEYGYGRQNYPDRRPDRLPWRALLLSCPQRELAALCYSPARSRPLDGRVPQGQTDRCAHLQPRPQLRASSPPHRDWPLHVEQILDFSWINPHCSHRG